MAYPIIKVYKENGSIIIDNGVKRKEYVSPASVSYSVLDVLVLRSPDTVTLKAAGMPIVTDKPVDSFCDEDGVKISPNVLWSELKAYFVSLGMAQNSGGGGTVDQEVTDSPNAVSGHAVIAYVADQPSGGGITQDQADARYVQTAKVSQAIIQGDTDPVAGGAVQSALAQKVNVNGNKQLSDNNYSDVDKAKVQAIVEHYRGEYPSYSALALITGRAGDYANVDVAGQPSVKYSWDVTDNIWVAGGSSTGGAVSSVNGKVGAVSLVQDDITPGTLYTQFPKTSETKLAGIAAGATANSTDAQLRDRATHTGVQPATSITEDATHRFTNDTTLARLAGTSGSNTGDQDLSGLVPNTRTINGKALSTNVVLTQDDIGAGTTNTQYTKTEQTKLSGIANGATANTNTDTLTEGTTNKYFTENRVLATLLSGISFVTSTAITATDSILSAFGKLQAQITAAVANLNNQITGINNKIDKNSAQLYFKQYFTQTDLDNDFTQVGLTTPATVDANGHIVLTRATAGNFDQYLAFKSLFSNDESLNMEITYMLTIASDTATKGLAVGLKSTNTVTAGKFSFSAFYNNTTGTPAVTVSNVESAAALATQAGSSGLFSALGNILKLTYTRGPSTQTATAQNLTKGGTFATTGVTVTTFNGNGAAAPASTPNTGQLAIFLMGTSTGSIKITSIKVTTNVAQTPFAAYYTDSKSVAFAGGNDLRHPTLFTGFFNRPVAVFAGPGDETKDLLLGLDSYLSYCKPKYGVVCIGRNDVQRGISLATTMANYSTIVNKIKATGAILIHLLPIPETAYDQAALKAAIITAYPNDYKIDVASGWDNTTMLSTVDNIHPNYDGHRYIAKVTYDFFIANNLT